MSAIRGLAVRISTLVVRCVSPGSKEWAEALAAEMEFIENDWSALAWSLGSLRVLLHHRGAPGTSVEDLIRSAKKLADARRAGNIAWIIFLGQAIHFAIFPESREPLQHFGQELTAVGCAVLSVWMFFDQRRGRKVPDGHNSAEMLSFYRTELERAAGFLRRPASWIVLMSFGCIAMGWTLGESGSFVAHPFKHALPSVLLVGFVLLFMHQRRSGLRQLARLRATLSEQE